MFRKRIAVGVSLYPWKEVLMKVKEVVFDGPFVINGASKTI